uniref:HTH_48 domain-containing protein n=1 Tax=Haemonchus contortus TaxID=6289 RepID=A0A7I5E8G6_HAECO
MDPTNPSILRPIAYYEFLQGHSAREAANNICAAFKKDVVHHSTVSCWYHRFEFGVISIEGQERPARNCDGMLYYEFLESNTTVTATTYPTQLQEVANAILHKYPKRLETYLLHDNARPHVATMWRRQKIQELGWEVLPHPPYSADLAPSDYHLFRALKRHLRDKNFDNQEQLKMEVGNSSSTQPADFWRSGIDKLPVKWMKVIDNNGDYITG